jgi:phage terminase large subunit
VLNYYEAQGQPLATHIQWLHANGYRPENTDVWLPHDGETNDRIHDVSFKSEFERARYSVEVIPNQGKGAAKQRIEAVRRKFPQMRFNEPTTAGGLAALGWYHEKRDAARGIGLGPEHDWSSHGADAMGLACIAQSDTAPIIAPLQFKSRRVA